LPVNKALRLTAVILTLVLLGGCSGFVKLPRPEIRVRFTDSLGNEVLLPKFVSIKVCTDP